MASLPACEKLISNPAIGKGEKKKGTKKQHKLQFMSELITYEREQKMEDGVLVGISKKKK